MKWFKRIFLANRLFYSLAGIAVIFIVGYFYPLFYQIAILLFFTFSALVVVDLILLFNINGINARRNTPEKLSNGDDNPIEIEIQNRYPLAVNCDIYDEIPPQFQIRDRTFATYLNTRETKKLIYYLHPVTRGAYDFGMINIYVFTILGLIKRRYTIDQSKKLAVYPGYIQMRKYELMAISNNLIDSGIKKIRRIGHNLEFEQIKDYIPGDDFRTINWKATARRSQLMVNSYQDEKSQQVYTVIDKGRVMKMPFEGMTLLDYAINAGLAISNIAIKKSDKAGLITFQHKVETIIPASKRNSQMNLIMQALYKQATSFLESDYGNLYFNLQKKIKTRSLILLYTNFESLSSIDRQLPYLKKLAKRHLLVTIFFKNTELDELLLTRAKKLEDVYIKTIAEKFSYEKRVVVKELNKHGIHTILTAPEKLTVNTINKYLELKARGLI